MAPAESTGTKPTPPPTVAPKASSEDLQKEPYTSQSTELPSPMQSEELVPFAFSAFCVHVLWRQAQRGARASRGERISTGNKDTDSQGK